MNPAELKARLNDTANPANAGDEPITAGLIGALTGHLNNVCGGDARRRQFLRYIYGVDSSRVLMADQWVQIRRWLDPKPMVNDGGLRQEWSVRAECYEDAKAVIRLQAEEEYAAKIAGGQLPLIPGL